MARKAQSSKTQSKQPQKRLSLEERKPQKGILDDYARRDIAGICFIILAVVFMLIAAMPNDGAIVTGTLSYGVHAALGIGSYILPFILAFIGITFLYRKGRDRLSLRAAIGFAIIFIALLGFIALFTPIVSMGKTDPDLLFSQRMVIHYGGYVGAAIAWVGVSLLGQVITGVILVGVMIIGLTIVGFSISRLIEKASRKAHELAEKRIAANGSYELFAPPARIKRQGAAQSYNQPVPESGSVQDALLQDVSNPKPDSKSITRQIPTQNGGKRKLRDNHVQIPLIAPADPNMTVALDSLEKTDEGSVCHQAMTRKLGASKKPKKAQADPSKPDEREIERDGFTLPSMSLLERPKSTKKSAANDKELQNTAELLQLTLRDFGIDAQVVGWEAGPTVTLFKVDLPSGVRVSRITVLGTDIALALATSSVRIFAPIPNTNYVGIEVPNAMRQTVYLSEVLEYAGDGPLQIALGKDVEGNPIISDLAKMPHLLIGGTTGSGKSVSVNAMIMSILMRATPSEVRFIMIDPKRVEFTPYNGIPHLYTPVVTEPREAAGALAWGVAEMERRLKLMSELGVRNISQYNHKIESEEIEDEENGEAQKPLPYIVIVIDELADLMMAVGKEVEASICRIAQLARAAGIHLIVATQRPSTNVVTGLIKSNITNRIAFNVASGIDSRVILDTTGAEDLIGLGDMLLSKPDLAKPMRIQGCFVSESEIESVVSMIKSQGEPDYHTDIVKTNLITIGASSPSGSDSSTDDPLIWDAAELVVSSGMGSTSNIQRRLKVGYARAGRIMDQLEDKGIVGPANGSKPREVLVDALELETIKAFEV